MKVVVIIPVGPGHAELAECARESVVVAWQRDRGQFQDMELVLVYDFEGLLGRSRARNKGMEQHPEADWFFFLDADDQMVSEAFRYCDRYGRATFGAVSLHGRMKDSWQGNIFPCTRQTLFEWDARGTLCMGFFMPAAYGLRFDESMDVGEDFDFYMRLPDFVKIKQPLVDIGYDERGAGGPRSSVGHPWQRVCAGVVERYRKQEEEEEKSSPPREKEMNGFISEGLIRTGAGTYYDPEDPGEIYYSGSPQRRSVTDEEAGILAELAKGKIVLEIGTGLAVSTRALASMAERVVTIDPDPWVQDPGLSGVLFYRRVTDIIGAMRCFDLVFIDGLHTVKAVEQDIIYCLALQIPLLVLHDTYLPEVQEAIHHCALREQEVYETRCRLATYIRS